VLRLTCYSLLFLDHLSIELEVFLDFLTPHVGTPLFLSISRLFYPTSSTTLVLCRIISFGILSLRLTPSMERSIALWTTQSFSADFCVSEAPYVITGSIHCSKTFRFRQTGISDINHILMKNFGESLVKVFRKTYKICSCNFLSEIIWSYRFWLVEFLPVKFLKYI